MKACLWLSLCLVLGVCVTIVGGQVAAAAPAAELEESYRQIFIPTDPALEIPSNFSPATVPAWEFCCNPPTGCCDRVPINSCETAGGTAFSHAAICLANCEFPGC